MDRTTDEWRCIEASGEPATLTTDELRSKLRAGQLTPTALVWRAGMPGWVPASRVPELGPEAKGPAPALPIGQHVAPPPVPKTTLLGVPPAPSAQAKGRTGPPPAPPPRAPKRSSGAPPVGPGGTLLLAIPPAAESGAPATTRSPLEAPSGAVATTTAQAAQAAQPSPPARPVAAGANAKPAPAENPGSTQPSASSGEGVGKVRAGEVVMARPVSSAALGKANSNGASSGDGSAQHLPRVVLNTPPAIERPSLPASPAPPPATPSRVPERAGGSTLLGLSPLTAEEAQQLGALVSDGRLSDPPEQASRPPPAPRPIVVPTSDAEALPSSMITRPAPFSAEAPDVRFPPAPLAPAPLAPAPLAPTPPAPGTPPPEAARPLGDFSVFDDPEEKKGGARALVAIRQHWPALPAGPKLVAAFFGGGLLTFGALTLFARMLSSSPAPPAPPRVEGLQTTSTLAPSPAPSPVPSPSPNHERAQARPGPNAACALGPVPTRLSPRVARDVPVELAAVPGSEAVAVGFATDGKGPPRGLRVDLASLAPTVEAVPPPRRPAPTAILRVLPVAGGGGPLRWVVDADREGDALPGGRTVPLETPFTVGLGEQGVLSARRAGEAPALAWEASTAGADALRPLAVAGVGAWVAFRQGGRVFAGLLDGEGKPRGELKALSDGGLSGSPYWGQGGDEVAVSFAWRASESEPWAMRVARGPKQGPLGPPVAFATPPGGPGGDAIAPAFAGLGDGRWVAAWTEGPSGARAVRVATLGPTGDVLGEASTVSTPGANAGQASVAVAPGAKVMVAYLTAAGRGVYELWGASLACPSLALGSSSP